MIAVTVVLLTLTAALPSVYQEGQREREEELLFRGNEYARAIFLFQKQFHRYPASVDELIRTNGVRFLRHAYTDPMSPSGKWRFIHVSPNGVLLDSRTQKVQLGPNPAGFGGQNQNSSAPVGFGFSNGGLESGQSPQVSQGASGLSLTANPGTGPSGQTGTAASSDSGQGQSTATTSSTAEPGEKPKPSPDCLGGKTGKAQSTSAFGTTSGFALSSQPAGALIAGVASCSERASIRVWNHYNHYSDWEFLGIGYTPFGGQQSPHASPGGGGTPGQPTNPNQPNQPTPAQPSPDQPSPAQPSPDQPAPTQPNPIQPSPLQPASPDQPGAGGSP